MRTQPNHSREILQSITGISDQEYTQRVYDVANQYLEIGFQFTADQRKKLTYCPLFWKWWMRQWNLREDALVTTHLLAKAIDEYRCWDLAGAWKMTHSPTNVLHLRPNRWALQSILSVITTHEENGRTKATA